MLNGEVVQQIFLPDPEQGARYALTPDWLYVWRNREWVATATENSGRVLLVDPNNTERLFRGDHPGCGSGQDAEPIPFEVSEDGGETWTAKPNGVNIRPLAVDPVFRQVLYGTDCSLTISTDLGETWTSFEPLANYEIVDLVVVGERLLVLGISTQGKSQIRELRLTTPDDPQISDAIFQVEGRAALDADPGRLVIGARDGVRVSMDGGQTWAFSRNGLESVTVAPDDTATREPWVQRPHSRFGIQVVVIDPYRTNRIFAGTVRGLYISQDNGGTWDYYRVIDDRSVILDIQFAHGGVDIFVTTDSGVVSVPNP